MDAIVGILGAFLLFTAVAWLFIWATVDDVVFSIIMLAGIALFVGFFVIA